ncbi:MAG: hypothetical protein ACYDHM_10500 [Acidiferrobacterales bacterium]
MSTASFAVGADPSIPTFSGAPEDQNLINTALAAANVDLTPPACATTAYVAPPASYSPAGVSQLGTGTQADPFRNLITVVNTATAGECIYLEPGTYEMSSMAQAFGLSQDALQPVNSGTQSDPIVLSTDPTKVDWSTGQVAVLDFQLQTSVTAGRYAAIWPLDYWTIENLGVKNALDRVLWMAGGHDVVFHNDFYHTELSGTQDNVGIIGVMRRTGGDYNDFVIGNNLHQLAEYDSSGNPIQWGGQDSVNVGCTYSENNQYYASATYASGFPANGDSLTVAQLATYTAPPDDNVYFYANVLHGCMRGIANKEPAVGPWYLLSNVIYDVQTGIKMPVSGTLSSHTLIRNNIIYNAGVQQLQAGIQFGVANTDRFLGNADNMTVSNNTVIDASVAATSLYGGFNDVVDSNVFVTTGSGVAHEVYPGGYSDGGTNTAGVTWYNSGTWPNAVGEYLFPVNASNPYYSAMPNFLQEEAGSYNAISFGNNLYTSTPTVVLAASPLAGPNLSGTNIDSNPTVMSWSSLAPLFRNAASDDFRAGTSPGVLATIGSQIQ